MAAPDQKKSPLSPNKNFAQEKSGIISEIQNLLRSDVSAIEEHQKNIASEIDLVRRAAATNPQLSPNEGAETQKLIDPKLTEIANLKDQAKLAEVIGKIKAQNPRADWLLKKVVANPNPPQSKLGRLFGRMAGGTLTEANNTILAKQKGVGYGLSWIAYNTVGKTFDFVEDRVFVKLLKTHAYDERGIRRFRPTMALDRKLHITDPASGKRFFRPTRAFATSKVGQTISSPFKKVSQGITKILKPFNKLAGKISGYVGAAISGAKLGFKIGGNFLKKIGGATLGVYFYLLLQGLLPVIIGATIGLAIGGMTGLIAGGIAGFQVGLAIAGVVAPFFGPFAPFVAVGIVTASTIAGALIGLGIGAFLGTVIGGTIGYIYAGHLGGTATLTGAGVGAGIGFAFGGPVGALLGAVIGGFVGYAFGEWIIPWFGEFFGGVGGLLGVAGGFLSWAGSGLWGGLEAGAGWLAKGLGLFGHALSLAAEVGPLAITVPVVIVGVQVVSVINGMNTGSAFFNPFGNQMIQKSAYVNVVKTANPNIMANADLGKTITFTITITAPKENLTSIVCTDEIRIVQQTASSPISQSIDCKPTNLNVGERIEVSLVFDTQSGQHEDSVIVNTVTVTAQTQTQGQQTSQAVASVSIGNPPADYPSTWPTSGYISSGTHHHLLTPEAIDIASLDGLPGNRICATHRGILYKNSGYGTSGLGTYARIESPLGFTSFYGHLQNFAPGLVDGQEVRAGDLIGYMDSGGNSTGNHLHYEFINLIMDIPNIPVHVPDNSLLSSQPRIDVLGCP